MLRHPVQEQVCCWLPVLPMQEPARASQPGLEQELMRPVPVVVCPIRRAVCSVHRLMAVAHLRQGRCSGTSGLPMPRWSRQLSFYSLSLLVPTDLPKPAKSVFLQAITQGIDLVLVCTTSHSCPDNSECGKRQKTLLVPSVAEIGSAGNAFVPARNVDGLAFPVGTSPAAFDYPPCTLQILVQIIREKMIPEVIGERNGNVVCIR